MVLSFIGACLLWVGWFGFNAGSALSAGPLATSAFINTQFAAAAAALTWTLAEWIHNGKPTALGAISGAVAGLATITQASGFVQPMSALVIGAHRRPGLLLHGLQGQEVLRLRRFARRLWRSWHRRNHRRAAHRTLASGAINAVFGKDASRPPTPTGAIDGNWHQISTRPSEPASAGCFAIVGTLVLLFVVDKIFGLRLSEADENRGLDLSQHGEEGYEFNA